MTDRMKDFDKCVDQLLNAVTSNLIHVDNIVSDIKKVAEVKVSREQREALSKIREETLKAFRDEVKKSIDTQLKDNLELKERFDELNNKRQQTKKKKAWRINGDPQHDTYAQRRQIYIDHQKKMCNVIKELEEERDDLLNKLQSE